MMAEACQQEFGRDRTWETRRLSLFFVSGRLNAGVSGAPIRSITAQPCYFAPLAHSRADATLPRAYLPFFLHRGESSARSKERRRAGPSRIAFGRDARCIARAASSTAPVCGCPTYRASSDSFAVRAPSAPGHATDGDVCESLSKPVASHSASSF